MLRRGAAEPIPGEGSAAQLRRNQVSLMSLLSRNTRGGFDRLVRSFRVRRGLCPPRSWLPTIISGTVSVKSLVRPDLNKDQAGDNRTDDLPRVLRNLILREGDP